MTKEETFHWEPTFDELAPRPGKVQGKGLIYLRL